MTAEELKSKIGFKTRKDELGHTVITGGLILSHEMWVNRHNVCFEQVCNNAKEVIREHIIREVYGWQRREFFEALDEFMSLHHALYDYEKAHAARDRLLEAARYQESDTKKEGR